MNFLSKETKNCRENFVEFSRIDISWTKIRQLIKERAGINPECICVYDKNAYDFNEEFEAHGKDHEGALLDQDELKADASGQDLVGQSRRDSLLKELGSRTYEFAAKGEADGKTTNEVPAGSESPVGTKQNKISTPPKGSVRWATVTECTAF